MGPPTKAKGMGDHEVFSDFLACVPRKINSHGKGMELISFKISKSSF